jgi:hypothetical protein
MTPELAAQLRGAFERQVVSALYPKDTPVSFYHHERFGPTQSSAQAYWRRAALEAMQRPTSLVRIPATTDEEPTPGE